MKPNPKLILEYNHFYNGEAPTNRLAFIKHIPKRDLIYEIAGLNYRLKSYKSLKYDISLEKQKEELGYFCQNNRYMINYFFGRLNSFVTKDSYPLIFNRAANLFALEEIINAEGFNEDDEFRLTNIEDWDAIIKYLLLVNKEVVKVKPIPTDKITLENISASAIVLNELMIEDNPINTVLRGLKFIEYIFRNPTYGPELKRYFQEVVKVDYERFIFNILSLSMANQQEKSFIEFVYTHEPEDFFLDFLSENTISNRNPITLLSVKKCPFYKDSEIRHVLLDINFLVSKSYNFLLNDFWFDFLKPQKKENRKEKYNYKHYRAVFGLFFEEYITEIIRNSFHHLKHPQPLLFDELKINSSVGEIEVADIYIRQSEKVLVGQVKSSSIYDKEKYGGDIDTLYRNNREQFFKDFGINQTFESIKTILKHSNSFDQTLDTSEKIEFYPVIILNDKVFQTPLLPHLLHVRFQELLATEDFTTHIIHPLVVINIADLEYLENSLATKKVTIWDVLKSHYLKFDNALMPPFIITADRFIEPDSITERVTGPIYKIINKYSEEKETNK
jgi:hypothetical protein